MDANRQNNSALYGGVLILVVGVLLLLNQIGILRAQEWFSFWATIFFLVAVFKFAQSDQWSGRLWGIFFFGVGVVLQLDQLGYIHLRFETMWPVFVIAAGLVMVIRALEKPKESSGSLTPHLNLFSFLGGGEYRIRSQNFRGGEISAFMGGFDVDLTEADIEGSEATVTVNTLMGGGVLRVPTTWAVMMNVSSILGGHSLKAREVGQVQKTLIVKGVAIFGGIEVRN